MALGCTLRHRRRVLRRTVRVVVLALVLAVFVGACVTGAALPASPYDAKVAGVAKAALLVPVYDASKVANPTPTVSAGNVKMGGTPGAFSVSPSGAAQYEVPLEVVPGRGGFQPKLALSYSSESGNGQVGVGFALSGLSEISRCSKTIADDDITDGVRLDNNDRFCLNGQKLVAVSGVYGADGTEYRTKPDTHVRIRSYRPAGTSSTVVGPTHFVVWTADGQIQEYGVNGTTVKVRLEGIGARHANVAWAISRAQDRSGNIILYQYGQVSDTEGSEAERWLQAIHYGHGTTLDRMVEMRYDTRPDPQVGYAYGAARNITRRLTSLTMSANVRWVEARP